MNATGDRKRRLEATERCLPWIVAVPPLMVDVLSGAGALARVLARVGPPGPTAEPGGLERVQGRPTFLASASRGWSKNRVMI